jgi:hypothetical protein
MWLGIPGVGRNRRRFRLWRETSSSEAVAYGVEDLTVQKREALWDQSVGVEIEILSTRARAARLTWQQKGHGC